MYSGRDLTKVFALEIKNYPSPWDWIKDRTEKGSYRGINVADYIPMTVEDETHEMQIAGINTYTRTTDQDLGSHIDFISRDCYSKMVQWNLANSNNGTAETPFPYLASNVYKFLEELYGKLPADVKSVITSKRALLEQRYSASGALTDATTWGWQDLGKLWLPSEYEVFGSVIWSTKGWGAGQAVQYPVFANSWKNRIKGAGAKGGRCGWWLLSATAGDFTNACIASSDGAAYYWHIVNTRHVPLCFRIAA